MFRDPPMFPAEEPPADERPRNKRRETLITVAVLGTVLVGIVWAMTATIGNSAGATLQQVRAATSVPDWLYPPLNVRQPEKTGQSGEVWATQQWCTAPDYARDLPREQVMQKIEEELRKPVPLSQPHCVVLYQSAPTPQIETSGKQSISVDGVQGWVWRLGPDVLTSPDFGQIFASVEGLRPAIRPGPRGELEPSAYVYAALLYHERERSDMRRKPAGVLAGPAITIQWTKDRVHYVIVGQDVEPITVDVLLGIANSLQPLTHGTER